MEDEKDPNILRFNTMLCFINFHNPGFKWKRDEYMKNASNANLRSNTVSNNTLQNLFPRPR